MREDQVIAGGLGRLCCADEDSQQGSVPLQPLPVFLLGYLK